MPLLGTRWVHLPDSEVVCVGMSPSDDPDGPAHAGDVLRRALGTPPPKQPEVLAKPLPTVKQME
eukprot:13891673-Alexandrium_andersonii.AAC.1